MVTEPVIHQGFNEYKIKVHQDTDLTKTVQQFYLHVTNVCADMLTNMGPYSMSRWKPEEVCLHINMTSVNIATTYIPKDPNQVWDLQVSPTFYRGGGAGDHDGDNPHGRGHQQRPHPPALSLQHPQRGRGRGGRCQPPPSQPRRGEG